MKLSRLGISSESFQGTGLWMTTGVSLLHIPLKSKQGTLYIRDSRGNKEERKEEREEQGEKRKGRKRESVGEGTGECRNCETNGRLEGSE